MHVSFIENKKRLTHYYEDIEWITLIMNNILQLKRERDKRRRECYTPDVGRSRRRSTNTPVSSSSQDVGLRAFAVAVQLLALRDVPARILPRLH